MKKHIIKLLITALFINVLFITSTYAAAPSGKTIKLEEDWRLTGPLDIAAGSGNTITIDGQNKYTIYEMDANAILTNSTGTVRLKDVQVINYGSKPADGSLAALEKAAATITSVQAPAKDATALTLPVLQGFSVTIASSSNQAVIAINGTITPPNTNTTVSLVLDVAGNGGIISTKSFAIVVPSKTDTTGGGSGGIGDGGSGGSVTDVPEVTSSTIIAPAPVVDTASGNATTMIDSKSISDAAAVAIAGSDGVKTVTIEVKKAEGTTTNTVQFPKAILNTDAVTEKLQIKTDIGILEVPSNMLSSMNTDGKNTVALQIGTVDKTKLVAAVRDSIGDRPVIELNVKLDNSVVAWSNQDAPVTVSIPYKPTAEELANPEHIVVWYIDGSGKVNAVPNGRYDPATGKVIFTTTHFSKYAVAYVNKTFADLGKYGWAKKQIEVLASKGVIKGKSATAYDPGGAMTRADFISLLIVALDLKATIDSTFDDVRPNDYYYTAVCIAKKLGITTGRGNNKFDPKAKITRQEMMVFTAKAMRIAKKLKTTGTLADLVSYTDRGKIDSNAVESIASLVKSGIIIGSGNKLNPVSNTTRAEAAVLIYKIVNIN